MPATAAQEAVGETAEEVAEEVAEETVVVLVPGLTGAKLRDRETGEIVWGKGSNLLFPRDGGYALARSLDAKAPPRLEAFELLDNLSLGLVVRRKIYGPIFRLFEDGGHRRGRLRDADPEASFYTFAYDWRQDVVESARRLARELEELRQARGQKELRVDLLCQSSGALLCRWVAKYGDATLDEAASGGAKDRGAPIRRMVLVGTANGGSLRNLQVMNRGRTYIPGIGRHNEAEVMFTFPSIFPDLPCYRADLFIDVEGHPLEVDLYDSENWLKYGWSIFGEEAGRRVEESGRTDLFADHKTRVSYLERWLERGQRTQALLQADAPLFAVESYYSIQNTDDVTSERAVLLQDDDGEWRTLFVGDDEITDELADRLADAGDGHATRASQLWLSPQEDAALAGKVLYVEGGHFSLIIGDESQEALSEIFGLEP